MLVQDLTRVVTSMALAAALSLAAVPALADEQKLAASKFFVIGAARRDDDDSAGGQSADDFAARHGHGLHGLRSPLIPILLQQ